MKIYTRTGDDGTTSLVGGARVKKHSLRVDAYGTIDELNAVLGVVRSHGVGQSVDQVLRRVQGELFELGGEVAAVPGSPTMKKMERLTEEHVKGLERDIDEAEDGVPPLKTFILPTGVPAAATLQLARTVARRAERRLVALAEEEPVREELLRYVNRLSDLLFTLARRANHDAGRADEPWQP